MVYTITFNPAIDYIVSVDNYKTGIVNRTSAEKILPGGKGINVSVVLNNLGTENIALGFVAGFTGVEIERLIAEYGCKSDFVRLDIGMSRINVKLKCDEETEVNGRGPVIDVSAMEKLYEKLSLLKDGDVLVLAGSAPSSLGANIYSEIMERLSGKELKVVVDATGELLKNTLKNKPFLIKPNTFELGEILGTVPNSFDEVADSAKKLQKMGAENVLVSMAGDGAILVTSAGEVIVSSAPKGKVINSTGAGDSMVAGFLSEYLKSSDFKRSLKMGIAAGSGSAFSSELVTKAEADEIFDKLN